MSPSSRIPPLLQPLVQTPKEDSLILLTSTLDASANCILGAFLRDALKPEADAYGSREDNAGRAKNVVLVSWMRDYAFWKQEVRKGAGLDLCGLRAQGRFAFVDGLSSLFLPACDDGEAEQLGQITSAIPPGISATRSPQPPSTRARPPAPGCASTATARAVPRPSTSSTGLYTLSSALLEHANATIATALASLRPSIVAPSTLVILDNPDILLAAVPALTPAKLTSLFLELHVQNSVSHVLVHLQSDLALLTPSAPPQALQTAHQNLVVKTAHMSASVLGVRVLDTGVARDVSGVLRATANRDSWASIGTRSDGGRSDVIETGAELLYKVQGDGSVRVFERGTTAV